MSKIYNDSVSDNILHARVTELEQQLAAFQSAVEHVTEDGYTRRSFVASEGWAMVHKDRLHDLEVAEDQLADAIQTSFDL